MPPKSPPRTSAYQSALRRLARRDHSRAELRRALLRQGHSPEATSAALERIGPYVDDRTYAARFARTRIAHSGQGPLRVRAALRRRGVSDEDASAGIDEAIQELPLDEALRNLAERYWERHSREVPARRILKLRAHLLRRGFPPSMIREHLAGLWPRGTSELTEDLDETP